MKRFLWKGMVSALGLTLVVSCGPAAAGAPPANGTSTVSNTVTADAASKPQNHSSASAPAKPSAQSPAPAKSSPHKSATTSPQASSLIPVVVSKSVDGDTIHVKMNNGKDETIRMLLIDTPESVDPRKPVEPFGPEASHYAKQKLPVGKHIWLQEGVPGYQRDKYGRLLAFVYLSPTDMYNEDVVKQGLARVAYIYPPNTQHLTALRQDEQYAKSRHLGIWSIAGYVTSSGYNLNAAKNTTTNTSTSSQSSGSSSSSGSLKLVSSTLNVSRGDSASISVQTKPGSHGSIEVDYKSGPSHASGLEPTTADGSGILSWTWTVGTHTAKGDWPVTVTVGTKTLRTTLHVH